MNNFIWTEETKVVGYFCDWEDYHLEVELATEERWSSDWDWTVYYGEGKNKKRVGYGTCNLHEKAIEAAAKCAADHKEVSSDSATQT